MRIFIAPIVISLLALGSIYWWSGLAAFFLALLLSILEITLSFDNAVVNAKVLAQMTPVWQKRFLTWGIAFAVFGMRVVFPLAIVAIAAGLGPVETVNLSLNNPAEYERIVSSAHVGIAGFGGAFLAMVGLEFFFDSDKDVHWIGVVERKLAAVSAVKAAEIAVLLLAMVLVEFSPLFQETNMVAWVEPVWLLRMLRP